MAARASAKRHGRAPVEERAPARPLVKPATGSAEQDGRAQGLGPAQRQESKGKCNQRPEPGGAKQRGHIKAWGQLDGQHAREHRQGNQRRSAAKQQPQRDADHGEHHDLGEKMHHDAGAGGAKAAQGGNRSLPFSDVGRDRIGHPNPADQQRGKPDQCQEAGKQPKEAGEVFGGILGRADFPGRLGKGGIEPVPRGSKIEPLKGDLVAVAGEDALLIEPGTGQRLGCNQGRLPELEALRGLIGQGNKHPARRKQAIADRERIAKRDPQPFEHLGIEHRAKKPIAFGQKLWQWHAGGLRAGFHRPGQRIGLIDGAQVEERTLAIGPGAGAEFDHPGHRPEGGKGSGFFGGGIAPLQAHFKIAPQDHPGVAINR
jgi:hypothetical protein